ncbi:MAG: type II toxin-antitoxin system HicA family toxin [bacterium]|nr:type II toxin-antitoxin system HicA family toxin [bacterium]
MPPLSQLPGNISRRKFLNALRKLGFRINEIGGKGSHVKIIWTNEKSVTVPTNLNKYVLRYVLTEIGEISGKTWEKIQQEL